MNKTLKYFINFKFILYLIFFGACSEEKPHRNIIDDMKEDLNVQDMSVQDMSVQDMSVQDMNLQDMKTEADLGPIRSEYTWRTENIPKNSCNFEQYVPLVSNVNDLLFGDIRVVKTFESKCGSLTDQYRGKDFKVYRNSRDEAIFINIINDVITRPGSSDKIWYTYAVDILNLSTEARHCIVLDMEEPAVTSLAFYDLVEKNLLIITKNSTDYKHRIYNIDLESDLVHEEVKISPVQFLDNRKYEPFWSNKEDVGFFYVDNNFDMLVYLAMEKLFLKMNILTKDIKGSVPVQNQGNTPFFVTNHNTKDFVYQTDDNQFSPGTFIAELNFCNSTQNKIRIPQYIMRELTRIETDKIALMSFKNDRYYYDLIDLSGKILKGGIVSDRILKQVNDKEFAVFDEVTGTLSILDENFSLLRNFPIIGVTPRVPIKNFNERIRRAHEAISYKNNYLLFDIGEVRNNIVEYEIFKIDTETGNSTSKKLNFEITNYDFEEEYLFTDAGTFVTNDNLIIFYSHGFYNVLELIPN